MKDFLELAGQRQSSRGFTDKPVEHEKLVKCIEAARLAPSGCNAQPWSFVVVEKPDLVAEVAKATQQMGMNGWSSTAKAFVVVLEEHAVLMPAIRKLIESQYFAKADLGGAYLSICLEAASQGLGSCIIGIFDREHLAKTLDIPIEKTFAVVIALGYPDEEKIRQKVRKPLEEIARFL
ncbi:MAG: nitroreductase family protein [Deltaproteobacteria bacterium]|nr:nitroreductase family protein [Deltaproteobacteria bacterium]